MPNLVTLDVIDRPIGGVSALSEGISGRKAFAARLLPPRPPPGAGPA